MRKTWPKLDPNQILVTLDLTQARSQNPKPDPSPEKRTRPIPTWSSRAIICLQGDNISKYLVYIAKIKIIRINDVRQGFTHVM